MGMARRESSSSGAQRVSSSQQLMGAQTAAMFADVPLAKRVNHWIEWSGSGILLDTASALLSVLTVITYMVETHYTEYDDVWQALRIVDQVCSIIFAAEWCFWLWLSRDRLGYIFSWQSLVDIVTIIPIFLSVLIGSKVPGFATFEALVRIFRVVRVFRVFRLGKRLKDEVLSCVLTVVFTLLAVIVTAAGVFYELETRFGERYPDLKIEQAIYWSVVTVTTIGYGDISPSITASQMTLLAMLFIAFTLLPYQTSMLVNALSETTIYQSAHYSHSTKGRHVVATGHLTAASSAVIVDEIFHPDSGFADYNLVFLNPNPPTDAMKRLLKTSQHAHRLLYLQGSYNSNQDLTRARIDACDAVFILCDKTPQDAKAKDLQTVMACLAIGLYIQRKEKVRLRTGPKPLMQRLLDGVGAFLVYFQKAKKAHGIPRMVIQLLLPESKQQLQQLLGLYSKHGLLATQEGSSRLSASGDAAGTDMAHDAAATIITKGEPSTEKAAALLDSLSNKWQEAASTPAQQATAALAAASGPQWWQRFSRQVTCLCITELRFGLLAHSCMGCPGTITLVSNLIRAVDDGLLTQAEFEELPEWAQEYLEGSSNELYELSAFPAHLRGQTVATVAEYVLDVHRAVLLATAGTHPASRFGSNSTRQGSQGGTLRAATNAAAGGQAADDSDHLPAGNADAGQQQLPSRPVGKLGALVLSAQTLSDQVTGHTVAYFIAADVRVIMDIMESTAEDFDAWKAEKRLKQQQARTLSKPLMKHSMAYQPAVAGALWRAKAAQHKQADGLLGSDSTIMRTITAPQQLLQQLQHRAGSLAGLAAHAGADGVQQAAVEMTPDTQSPSACHAAPGSAAQDPVNTQHTLSASAAAVPQLKQAAEVSSEDAPAPVPQSDPRPGSSPSSRRTTAEQRSRRSSAGGLKGVSAKSLLAALVAGTPAGAQDSGAQGRQGRHLHTIQVTRGTALLDDGPDDDNDVQCLTSRYPNSQPLATPSQKRRTAMELSMQQLYHIRPWSMTTAECVETLGQDEVRLEGHLLVCGCGTPPAALACLLKPLRSTALPGQTRPIVVLDTTTPTGPEWEELARLSDVYHVEGNPQSTEALIRACADSAATAVVLLPWSQPTAATAMDDIVNAGMVDAGVLSVIRRLRALNPHVQVFSELTQYQSLRFLDPLGSLLDDCVVDEAAAAAASPACMSGAVLLPLMDILLCQAINNRGTPHILGSILSTWHRQALVHSAASKQPGSQLTATSGSGSAGQPATTDTCMQQKALVLLQPEQPHAHGAAVLQQVPVQHAHCSTFGELFDWLLQHENMLCCGLYRQVMHYGIPLWYVYTNPHKDTLLRCTDRAFVLAVMQPCKAANLP